MHADFTPVPWQKLPTTGGVTNLHSVAANPIHRNAGAGRSALVAEAGSKRIAWSTRAPVAEQHPSQPTTKSSTEAAARRRRSRRTRCNDRELQDALVAASGMAPDTCNCRRAREC